MRSNIPTVAAAVALLAAAAAAQAAGTVQVTFTEPEKFTDAGNRLYDTPATLKVIEQHLKDLGTRYLADGQVLSVEVTDIDLAGDTRPLRNGQEVRVVRGKADWPRIKLKYALQANGQPVKQGEEALADLNFTSRTRGYSSHEPMRYEKQMLERWFRERFTEAH